MRNDVIGAMVNPGDRKSVDVLTGIRFALDNGRFAKNWKLEKWRSALERYSVLQEDCLFAVVPDVLCDPIATRQDWDAWSGLVKDLNYKTAYVGQDGLDLTDIPWDEFDTWFLGGSTEWKLSEHAAKSVSMAKERGKQAHMGRVNSYKRLQYAQDIGCDTADGTFLKFGPEKNLLRIENWLRKLREPLPGWII